MLRNEEGEEIVRCCLFAVVHNCPSLGTEMLSATRIVSLGYSAAMRSGSSAFWWMCFDVVITRSFAAQTSEQRKRMDEYNRQRKAYREQVATVLEA
mgnify:FL=1